MIKITRNLSGPGALLVCALLLICSAGTAKAEIYAVDTTLDYTGAAFTSCYGSYSTNPASTAASPGSCVNPAPYVSGWMTIDGYVYSGWNSYTWPTTELGGPYTASLSFSFTDNDLVTLNSSTLYEGSCDGCIQLDYDPNNGFIGWQIALTCDADQSGAGNCGTGLGSSKIGICSTTGEYCGGAGDNSYAYIIPDPGGSNTVAGTFVPVGTTVPEPRNLALFGSGLMLSVLLRRKLNCKIQKLWANRHTVR